MSGFLIETVTLSTRQPSGYPYQVMAFNNFSACSELKMYDFIDLQIFRIDVENSH